LFFLTWKVEFSEKPVLECKNLGLFHELTLLDGKIGVWCAMSTRREVSTNFGQEVQGVNNLLQRYNDHIRSGGRHLQHLL
jgi:hypothetical protein